MVVPLSIFLLNLELYSELFIAHSKDPRPNKTRALGLKSKLIRNYVVLTTVGLAFLILLEVGTDRNSLLEIRGICWVFIPHSINVLH